MSEMERVIVHGVTGEELYFEWPGRAIVAIDEDGVAYAIVKGGKWVAGAFDADKQQEDAAREIDAALKP